MASESEKTQSRQDLINKDIEKYIESRHHHKISWKEKFNFFKKNKKDIPREKVDLILGSSENSKETNKNFSKLPLTINTNKYEHNSAESQKDFSASDFEQLKESNDPVESQLCLDNIQQIPKREEKSGIVSINLSKKEKTDKKNLENKSDQRKPFFQEINLNYGSVIKKHIRDFKKTINPDKLVYKLTSISKLIKKKVLEFQQKKNQKRSEPAGTNKNKESLLLNLQPMMKALEKFFTSLFSEISLNKKRPFEMSKIGNRNLISSTVSKVSIFYEDQERTRDFSPSVLGKQNRDAIEIWELIISLISHLPDKSQRKISSSKRFIDVKEKMRFIK